MGSTETLGLTPHRAPRVPRAAPAAGSSGTRGRGSARAPQPTHGRRAPPTAAPREGAGASRVQRSGPPGPYRYRRWRRSSAILPSRLCASCASSPWRSRSRPRRKRWGGRTLPPAAEEDPGEGPALPRPARPLQTAAAAVGARCLSLACARNSRRSGASLPRPCVPEVIACPQR